MQRSDFHYELPAGLIAQAPLAERTASRLLELDGTTGRIRDLRFSGLPGLLAAGDLLVLNDTRVLPARLLGRKRTGGAVEILIERPTGPGTALAQLRASRLPAGGTSILLPGGATARIERRDGRLFELQFDRALEPYLASHGQVPLPPYITRAADARDRDRYQTVFARQAGAVAAPTAGLHFDRPMLEALAGVGIEHAFLTLHVGLGTFEPVRSERLEAHVLHPERCRVPPVLCERIEQTRARGGRIVAVGTTVVRALETATRHGRLEPFEGETRLFIHPGYRFRVVDALLTNFHLPESSLLMLVAAFAGRERTLAAYRHAVEQRYRFFSYGDAMFVTRAGRDADEV